MTAHSGAGSDILIYAFTMESEVEEQRSLFPLSSSSVKDYPFSTAELIFLTLVGLWKERC